MWAKIFVGCPGAGKSTLAARYVAEGYTQIERDLIRYELFGKWYGVDEGAVTRVHEKRIKEALLAGKNVIISDTNTNPDTREHLAKFCASFGAQVSFVHVGAGLLLDDLIKRNAGREQKGKIVPNSVIHDMYTRYRLDYPLRHIPNQHPDAYVYDVDGTLANMAGGRGPFEWSKVGQDEPYHDVINLLRILSQHAKILMVSGRDEVCRAETVDWFNRHEIPFDELFMREKGSQLKDSIVKHDIYHGKIAPKYNVLGVFDDRNQVVEMWRSMGLRCYQVQLGNF